MRKSIILNGWEVHLFPVEVGARGYCGTSIKSCFLRLGFSNKLVHSLLKSLSKTSIKSSFHIWQSWDTRHWNTPVPFGQTPNVFKTNVRSPNPKPKTTGIKKMSNTQKSSKKVHLTSVNVEIVNKGNTCYINSVLQHNAVKDVVSNIFVVLSWSVIFFSLIAREWILVLKINFNVIKIFQLKTPREAK